MASFFSFVSDIVAFFERPPELRAFVFYLCGGKGKRKKTHQKVKVEAPQQLSRLYVYMAT
jgi:hypothetical protein